MNGAHGRVELIMDLVKRVKKEQQQRARKRLPTLIERSVS